MSYHRDGPPIPILKSPQPGTNRSVFVEAAIVVYPTQDDANNGTRGQLCYTVAQAAALLGISEKGVYQLVNRGSLSSKYSWGKMALNNAVPDRF